MKEWLVTSAKADRAALAREAYEFVASTPVKTRTRGKAKR
jgi:hypothetical protein